MIKLLADSGSTKTDWLLQSNQGLRHRFLTSGMNPSLMDDDTLVHLLRTEVVPALSTGLEEFFLDDVETYRHLHSHDKLIDEIAFYGAGCRSEQEGRMARLLCGYLRGHHATVASDLLGAAHALCDTHEGIVCILGTGSGSALYDGARFVLQTPSLGFILGDEGSGASLGKHLLANVLKGVFPPHICSAFIDTYQMDVGTAIQHVYREKAPNRYMAQFTHFLAEHRKESSIRQFLIDEFRLFFSRNIRNYGRPDLKVNFVGSISAVFQEELTEAATAEGFQVGVVERSPIDVMERKLSQPHFQ